MEWIQQILRESVPYHGTIGVMLVVVFYLLSFPVKGLLGWVGRKIFARTETVLDDLILDVARKNIRSMMVLVGLHIGLREIHKAIAPADETALQILDYCNAIVYVAIVIVVLKVVLGVLRVIIDWYLDQLANTGAVQLKMTLGPLVGRVVNIVIGMVALIIVLDHFNINIGSLIVSLGVGSLAVALAAQDTLANMIAGFVILVDRPFSVGDRIELPTGEVGDIHQIGLRSTKILNFDNNLVIIPNAELIKTRIINHAFPFHQMRARVKVGVAYGTDPTKVRSILLKLAGEHPDILPEPAPEVYFTAMNDSSIEFTLMARASEYGKRYAAENWLREQAYLEFGKQGIEIPFPQRVVHMKQGS